MPDAAPTLEHPSTPATPPDDKTKDIVGRVASPPQKESTSEEFYFWVRDDVLVERGQIVRTELPHGGSVIRFYAAVQEVYRQSRLRSLAEARDRHDGKADYTPPFDLPGVNFARASVLRSVPEVACPPADGAAVMVADERDAALAYGVDHFGDPLAVGLIKNGSRRTAGPGSVDLDYVLGTNGGHVNVTGVAGRGTKSSFLLHVNQLLIREAQRRKAGRPGDPHRLKVVPLILNVKNFDLFHIDRRSMRYDEAKHGADWRDLGIDDPRPFERVRYLAPQQPGTNNPIKTGRTSGVDPYSYSLADVIERGLFRYLFAEDDVEESNFGVLTLSIEDWLTRERKAKGGEQTYELREDRPQTFQELLELVDAWGQDIKSAPIAGKHHTGTVRKFHRRLLKMVLEGQGVLRRHDKTGRPLDVAARDNADPTVIDLSSLARVPSLQRFVAATVFRQLVDDRTGLKAVPGLVYLVTLDELNRFAPKGAKDPITRLVEQVAAEMRSQGIILLGAQQQASLVSARVIENAGLRVLGQTGSLELGERVWRFLSPAARSRAMQLGQDEKLLIQDGFREPMPVKIPFPPYALRQQEAALPPMENHPGDAFDAP